MRTGQQEQPSRQQQMESDGVKIREGRKEAKIKNESVDRRRNRHKGEEKR